MTGFLVSRLKLVPLRYQRFNHIRRMIKSLRNKYCKVSKFSDARKLCSNLPKIQTKSPNLRVFSQEDASGIGNSKDPDQIAPLGSGFA